MEIVNHSGTCIFLFSDDNKIVNVLFGLVLKYSIRHKMNISMRRNEEIRGKPKSCNENFIIIADEKKINLMTELHTTYGDANLEQAHYILVTEKVWANYYYDSVTCDELRSKIEDLIETKYFMRKLA